ncbi:helix-turn-helix domain-containing protein [Citrifermentans pelophilum]|uniref:helix-turn-helix domain-containing protein n=1 Tax=Geoanaerobacter pelophilus TaxID=60036 RepID=UPI001BE03C95|nr:helix-turn-helix transcriptional regulator [Geoanaerobacter pelophilus]
MHTVVDHTVIGKKIREFRLSAGLTQEGLAERLGVTFQQVQKYERGVTKVNLMRLQELAIILGVPVSAFFDESSLVVFYLSEEESRLLKAFKQVPETLRGSVLEIVDNLGQKKS